MIVGEEGVDDQVVARGSTGRKAVEAGVPIRMVTVSSTRLDYCSLAKDQGHRYPPPLLVFGRVIIPGDSSRLGGLSKSKSRENESIMELVSLVSELDFLEGLCEDRENL